VFNPGIGADEPVRNSTATKRRRGKKAATTQVAATIFYRADRFAERS
jgi:hypothetical protein